MLNSGSVLLLRGPQIGGQIPHLRPSKLPFTHRMVRPVPVFGSDGSSGEGVFLCVATLFNTRGRFRFRLQFLENSSDGSSPGCLAHRNRSDFCDLRLRCPSRTPEIAAVSERRDSSCFFPFAMSLSFLCVIAFFSKDFGFLRSFLSCFEEKRGLERQGTVPMVPASGSGSVPAPP